MSQRTPDLRFGKNSGKCALVRLEMTGPAVRDRYRDGDPEAIERSVRREFAAIRIWNRVPSPPSTDCRLEPQRVACPRRMLPGFQPRPLFCVSYQSATGRNYHHAITARLVNARFGRRQIRSQEPMLCHGERGVVTLHFMTGSGTWEPWDGIPILSLTLSNPIPPTVTRPESRPTSCHDFSSPGGGKQRDRGLDQHPLLQPTRRYRTSTVSFVRIHQASVGVIPSHTASTEGTTNRTSLTNGRQGRDVRRGSVWLGRCPIVPRRYTSPRMCRTGTWNKCGRSRGACANEQRGPRRAGIHGGKAVVVLHAQKSQYFCVDPRSTNEDVSRGVHLKRPRTGLIWARSTEAGAKRMRGTPWRVNLHRLA